jgi:hypothetical protein
MQQDLFSSGMAEGAFDIDLGHRQVISRAMSNCGKDRYQIAMEMSRAAKATVTKEMLDKYAASDPANGMRGAMLTAFCHVTGTFEPIRYLLEPLGADVLKPEDQPLIEWAQLTRDREQIDRRLQELESKNGIRRK